MFVKHFLHLIKPLRPKFCTLKCFSACNYNTQNPKATADGHKMSEINSPLLQTVMA